MALLAPSDSGLARLALKSAQLHNLVPLCHVLAAKCSQDTIKRNLPFVVYNDFTATPLSSETIEALTVPQQVVPRC
jgi:hypothetical protein